MLKNIKKGFWRDKGWTDIAQLGGYSESNSKIIYGLLSDRAHSGNLSVMQVYQAISFKDRIELIGASINHILMNISFMIKYYCDFFPKSKKLFSEKYPEPNIVTLWFGVGSGKNIYKLYK